VRQAIVQPDTLRWRRRWDAMTEEQREAHRARRRERYRANPEPYLCEAREYRQWQREDRERRRKVAAGEMSVRHGRLSLCSRLPCESDSTVINGQSA